jgi:CHAD domain-containing protein
VRKVLRSQAYRKEIDRLQKLFADASALPGGPKGEEKSLTFACRLILKRYDKVCKIARSIDAATEDEVVHQLRINCKKLRYLMEFFAPLFPENDIKTLIKGLKLLQDNLGNFNDYSVQQIFLRQVLEEKMVLFGKSKLKVAESVGALTAILHNLQQKERRKILKNFVRFDSPETRATFARLFTTHENEKSIDEDNSLLQ